MTTGAKIGVLVGGLALLGVAAYFIYPLITRGNLRGASGGNSNGESPYEGKIVKTADSAATYGVQGGKKRGFPSMEVFQKVTGLGWVTGNETILTGEQLNAIPTGEPFA